ncbi:MAG TPA: hypothetical protein VHN11_07975 [Xanthobacteraceae bacterium]|jgi:hypothetical protein|nr:hypothetical protein [Xanthobacteraceae bacterium]
MGNIICSVRTQTAKYDGQACERVRAVTEEDGEAFNPAIAKTVVKLEDGSEAIVLNDEIKG